MSSVRRSAAGALRHLRRSLSRFAGVWAAPVILFALRLSRRRAGIVLLYHSVEPVEGAREQELVPAVGCDRFAEQIRHLRRHYEIVPAEQIFDAVADRGFGRRFPASLTFDDDLEQHLEYAAPILEAERVPATFFLSGTSLEGRRNTWWERLQRAVHRGVAPAHLVALLPTGVAESLGDEDVDIHALAAAIEALEPDERDAMTERLLEPAGPDRSDAGLSAAQIDSLGSVRRASIGFHTLRHDPLTRLDDDRLGEAMSVGRDGLSHICGHPLDLIAYPHGYADGRVADVARAAGFRFGFTARRCAVTPAADPMLLGRCDSAGISSSAGAFALGAVRTLLTKGEGGERR